MIRPRSLAPRLAVAVIAGRLPQRWPVAAWLASGAFLLGVQMAHAAPTGDATRGEAVHEVCLQCHDTSVYEPPKRRGKTLAALQRETRRWSDMYNPRLTAQEVADLVAFLNARFYHF